MLNTIRDADQHPRFPVDRQVTRMMTETSETVQAKPGSWHRACNIILRTAHICTCSVLMGGHLFGIEPGWILPWTYAAILTGAALLFLEAYPGWRYTCEGRGLMVLAKLALLALVPLAWGARVPILFGVIVLGSIGSHMPRKYRHYSILGRRAVIQNK